MSATRRREGRHHGQRLRKHRATFVWNGNLYQTCGANVANDHNANCSMSPFIVGRGTMGFVQPARTTGFADLPTFPSLEFPCA